MLGKIIWLEKNDSTEQPYLFWNCSQLFLSPIFCLALFLFLVLIEFDVWHLDGQASFYWLYLLVINRSARTAFELTSKVERSLFRGSVIHCLSAIYILLVEFRDWNRGKNWLPVKYFLFSPLSWWLVAGRVLQKIAHILFKSPSITFPFRLLLSNTRTLATPRLTLKPQNSHIDVYELHNVRRSVNSEILKLWNDRSGYFYPVCKKLLLIKKKKTRKKTRNIPFLQWRNISRPLLLIDTWKHEYISKLWLRLSVPSQPRVSFRIIWIGPRYSFSYPEASCRFTF